MQTGTGEIAHFKIITGAEGNRYQFFCDISGALIYTSEPVLLDTIEQEVEFVWESDGKKHFNMCQRCGRWVSDTVYNVETLECVECSPWEEEPSYCPHCGEKVRDGAVFCVKCKNRLRYGNAGEFDGAEIDCILQTSEARETDGGEWSNRIAWTDPYEFGYGPRAMREAKVCPHCGGTEKADKYICSKCGKRLPTQTIFQIYQSKHKACKLCDTVLAAYMRYCPHCGTEIK